MSFPKMKIETRSPLAGTENQSCEDLHTIHEKPNKSFTRPFSGKNQEILGLHKQKFAGNQLSKTKSSNKTLLDKSPNAVNLISKLKPRQIAIEKERLYEENIGLKIKNNSLQDEVLKLKTKLLHIEKELIKREDPMEDKNLYSIKPPNLISNLKQTIKELKGKVQSKDEEIEKLVKNIKSSKIAELESQVQAYNDECTRLKRHLEATLKHYAGEKEEQADPEIVKQEYLVENLTKDNKELVKRMNSLKEELEKAKQKLQENEAKKKQLGAKKGEIASLKIEVQKLKDQNDHLLKSLAEHGNRENAYKDELAKLKKIIKEEKNRTLTNDKKTRELSVKIKDHDISKKTLPKEHKKRASHEETQIAMFSDSVPPLIQTLKSLFKRQNLSIDTFVKEIDKSSKGFIAFQELFAYMENHGFIINHHHFASVPQAFIKEKDAIDLKILASLYRSSQKSLLIDSKEETPQIEFFTFESPIHKYENSRLSITKDHESSESIEIARKFKNNSYKNTKIKEKTSLEAIYLHDHLKSGKSSATHSKANSKKFEVTILSDDEKKVDDLKREKPNKSSKDSKKRTRNSKDSEVYLENPSTPCPFVLDHNLIEIFQHICYRMQMNRLPKSKFLITLFGAIDKDNQIKPEDITACFKKAPFNFKDSSTFESLISFLIPPGATIKSAGEALIKAMDDWEIFSQQDEETFDTQLGLIISKNKEVLKKKCKDIDKDSKGLIKSEDFNAILDELSIKIPERLWNYMKLLFYSNDFQLGKVPYRYFIKAYGNAIEDHADYAVQPSERVESPIVNTYLAAISSVLAQSNLSVAEVFECDDEGLISPEQFLDGLRSIGFEDIDEELVMGIVEALRYQDSQHLCLHIEELNEILQNVTTEKASDVLTENRSSSNIPSAHEPGLTSQGPIIKLIPTESGPNERVSAEF